MEESVLKRNANIFDLFKKGSTLSQLGSKFKLTRERVRQIILAIIRKDILYKLLRKELPNNSGLSHYEYLNSKDGKKIIRNRLEGIFEERRRSYELQNKQQMQEKIRQSEILGIVPEKYSSLYKYAEAIGADSQRLGLFFPELAKKMKMNLTRGHGGRRWSRHYLKCRVCGTDTVRHVSHGYCEDCLGKSEYFKEIQRSSRLRHLESRIKHDKEYLKTYLKRPEVKLKMKQKQREIMDRKLFGGNREKSIMAHDNKCFKCGIPRNEVLQIYKKDLCVIHANGKKEDNSIENLIPLCTSCFRTYVWNKTFINR